MRQRVTLPSDKVLLRLRDDKGMSHGEIAGLYGVGRSTITKRFLAMERAMHTDADAPHTEVVSTRKK